MGLMSIESQEGDLRKIIVDTHLTNPVGGIMRFKIKEEMNLKEVRKVQTWEPTSVLSTTVGSS